MVGNKYEYFDYDGAYFRKRAESGLYRVDDVYWLLDGWVRYTGDAHKRYCYGYPITESDCFRAIQAQTRAAIGRAVDSVAVALRAIGGRKRPRMIDMTEQNRGKAFQILAAPGKPKPR
jgi:hypothetical protein